MFEGIFDAVAAVGQKLTTHDTHKHHKHPRTKNNQQTRRVLKLFYFGIKKIYVRAFSENKIGILRV